MIPVALTGNGTTGAGPGPHPARSSPCSPPALTAVPFRPVTRRPYRLPRPAAGGGRRDTRPGRGFRSGAETLFVLGGGDSEAALEVPVQVALVGEASSGGGRRGCLACFKQAAGAADPVRELQRMRWQAGALAEEADEAEFADSGGGGELVEADIAFGPVSEVVPRQAQRLVVAGAERRSPRAAGWGTVDQGAQPICQPFVALEPGGGSLQGGMQRQAGCPFR